jgi:hypothetical protein
MSQNWPTRIVVLPPNFPVHNHNTFVPGFPRVALSRALPVELTWKGEATIALGNNTAFMSTTMSVTSHLDARGHSYRVVFR